MVLYVELAISHPEIANLHGGYGVRPTRRIRVCLLLRKGACVPHVKQLRR